MAGDTRAPKDLPMTRPFTNLGVLAEHPAQDSESQAQGQVGGFDKRYTTTGDGVPQLENVVAQNLDRPIRMERIDQNLTGRLWPGFRWFLRSAGIPACAS